MTTTRKQYSPQFKARVATEAIRGGKTLSQLGLQFKLHPMQIAKWRKVAIDQLPELFVDGRTRRAGNGEADNDALYHLNPAHSTSGMPLSSLIDGPYRRFWYSEPYLTFGEVRLRCVGHHEIYESPVIIGV